MTISGWSIVALLHILVNVIVLPLVQKFQSGQQDSRYPEKRELPTRLVISDDGEVLDIEAEDDDSFRGTASRNTAQ